MVCTSVMNLGFSAEFPELLGHPIPIIYVYIYIYMHIYTYNKVYIYYYTKLYSMKFPSYSHLSLRIVADPHIFHAETSLNHVIQWNLLGQTTRNFSGHDPAKFHTDSGAPSANSAGLGLSQHQLGTWHCRNQVRQNRSSNPITSNGWFP